MCQPKAHLSKKRSNSVNSQLNNKLTHPLLYPIVNQLTQKSPCNTNQSVSLNPRLLPFLRWLQIWRGDQELSWIILRDTPLTNRTLTSSNTSSKKISTTLIRHHLRARTFSLTVSQLISREKVCSKFMKKDLIRLIKSKALSRKETPDLLWDHKLIAQRAVTTKLAAARAEPRMMVWHYWARILLWQSSPMSELLMIENLKYIKTMTSVAATRTHSCRELPLLESKIYRQLATGKIVPSDLSKTASPRSSWIPHKKRNPALNNTKKYNSSFLKAISIYKTNKMKFNKTPRDCLQKK